MSKDIRLSEVVSSKQEENANYAKEKCNRVLTKIREILDEEFQNQYNEAYMFSLYNRKGNDVNTMGVSSMLGHGVISGFDESLFITSINNFGLGEGVG